MPLEDDIGGEFDRADRLIAGYLFFTNILDYCLRLSLLASISPSANLAFNQ